MTAALQGFRERSDNKTTIEALSKLFLNKASTEALCDEANVSAVVTPLRSSSSTKNAACAAQ